MIIQKTEAQLVYLHIGTLKTGSTSIQSFLSKNRYSFLDQGILYPLYGRRYTRENYPLAHHNLPVELTVKMRNHLQEMYDINSEGWEEIITEINKFEGKKILISSEHFSRLMIDEVAKIREYLSNFKVKIIIYLRRQDDYFQSYYCQNVKTGIYYGDIRDYIKKTKKNGDYYQMLEPWSKIFGRENIIVKVFHKKLKDQLIKDFLQTIGAVNNQFKYPGQKNISPSMKVIKVMNVLNTIAQDKLSITEKDCRRFYLNTLVKPNQKLSIIINKIPDFLIDNKLLSEKEKVEIMKEFKQSNEKVAKEYLDKKNGQLFD